MIETEAQAREYLEEIKARLTRLVDNRPFVFRDTYRADAEKYLARKKRFEGISPADIAVKESALNQQFPQCFRLYLEMMGHQHGDLFIGSDVRFEEYEEFRAEAEELYEDNEMTSLLQPDDVIFLFHQGYTYCFLKSGSYFDGPIYQYMEGDEAEKQIAPSFLSLLDSELILMESNHANSHKTGGYFVRITSDGYVHTTSPAQKDNVRPLEVGDRFLD